MSRNVLYCATKMGIPVTPRERRVSRNVAKGKNTFEFPVTPRERRVSRNLAKLNLVNPPSGHASREACE